MGEPRHRVAADAAVALRDVRPVDVLSQPEKNTRSALVCAFGQHDFVSLAECRNSRMWAYHVRVTPFVRHVYHLLRLRPEVRLVHEPGPFKLGSLGFLVRRYPLGIPIRRFLFVEPSRFENGGLGWSFQPL